MLNLKKTAVAVLALGSSAAFAGTMGPVCTAGNVTVPCESTAWDFGIEALYLQPSYSNDFGYAGATTTTVPGSVTESYVSASPKWNWGFKLEGSYHFGTGSDLNLNWYHLGQKSTTRTYGNTFVPTFGLGTSTSTRVTAKPAWDAVNLEFGQHVDFSEFKNVRFHAGLQYARVQDKRSAVGTTGSSVYNFSQTSKYSGIGPRVGADFMYGFGNGLGLYAKGATAILAGTSKVNSAQSNNFQINATALRSSRSTIVPELEGTLGVNYTYAMAQGNLTLDVGYMWQNYFNVLARPTSDSNFGVSGLIFGGKWVGSIA